MASGTPDLADNGPFFGETDEDPRAGGPRQRAPWKDGILPICAAAIIFAVGVTVALVLHICLWERPVSVKGALVTDHERCTEIGQKVLHDRGSSVDAAVAAALCLGVVHPHTSGVGGGGVMLVHDIGGKQTRAINFQETTPSAIREEMLQHALQIKPGLLVGVPGMLRGLRQAHDMYGRLPWKDVVTRAADVARDGFNMSHSLAEAIEKVKGENTSGRFRETFFPAGRDVHPGSFLTMPGLAVVLDAGLSEFYSGNLSREMADEVQANGGVLSRADISNYSAEIGQPVEGLYHGFRVLVPPLPTAGAAVISALNLNLLEGFKSTANGSDHRVTETLADVLHQLIRSSASESGTADSLQDEPLAGQVAVMGPDDLIVAVASSLGRPFGSRIITPSGILLNSHILGFSWTNKTQEPLHVQRRTRIQPGRRPMSFLVPTIVLPSRNTCGTYMALSSPDGDQGLSATTQVLINALVSYEAVNDSLSVGGVHSNRVGVDSERPEADREERGRVGGAVQSLGSLPRVQGLKRNKDVIEVVAEPPPSFHGFQ